MTTHQDVTALLNDPVAQELLNSNNLAKLAYVWRDGTPRVIPIWFHWNGQALVFGTPSTSPKAKFLSTNTPVAVTIDSQVWPYHVLYIRGPLTVEVVDGVVPEYAAAAERYFGREQGKAWVGQVAQMFAQMTRLVVTPEWVNILDFEKRFPSAIAAAMAGQG
jgi:hypothetical protein